MTLDAVTIGNATIDAFLILAGSNSAVSLDNVHKRLCVDYGQKIPLESCDFFLGGNACNVAVGLSRAGFKTAIIAEIARDEFSEKILNGLKKKMWRLIFLLRGRVSRLLVLRLISRVSVLFLWSIVIGSIILT